MLDPKDRLLGVVSFRELFAASGDTRAQELMRTEVVAAPAEMDQEAVSLLFAQYDLIALLVVDADGYLKGWAPAITSPGSWSATKRWPGCCARLSPVPPCNRRWPAPGSAGGGPACRSSGTLAASLSAPPQAYQEQETAEP